MPMKIVDCRSHRAQEEVEAQRRAAIRVLTGFSGMTCFASNWVGAGGKTTSNALQRPRKRNRYLHQESRYVMCWQGGWLEAARKNLVKMTLRNLYRWHSRRTTGENHLKSRLRRYVVVIYSCIFPNSTDSSELYYLHQWQFGVSASARKLLTNHSSESSSR